MFWHAGAYEDHRLAIAGMSQCSESGAPKAGFAQLGRSGRLSGAGVKLFARALNIIGVP